MPEFIPFKFKVVLATSADSKEILCAGQFSEVSGLEVTMEPKVIAEGGRNWGEYQRTGPSKFSPIVLKRGITSVNHLWSWMDATTRGASYGFRLMGSIEVLSNRSEKFTTEAGDTGGGDEDGPAKPILSWRLLKVMPVKFKGPDLTSTASQVAIEEVHLVHEGIELVQNPLVKDKAG